MLIPGWELNEVVIPISQAFHLRQAFKYSSWPKWKSSSLFPPELHSMQPISGYICKSWGKLKHLCMPVGCNDYYFNTLFFHTSASKTNIKAFNMVSLTKITIFSWTSFLWHMFKSYDIVNLKFLACLSTWNFIVLYCRCSNNNDNVWIFTHSSQLLTE